MFIDIHAHCYQERPPVGPPFPHPEELIAVYDVLEIEKGCLLPIVSPEIYLPQSNEEILRIAEKYPVRFIPFCNIDPRAMSNSLTRSWIFRFSIIRIEAAAASAR